LSLFHYKVKAIFFTLSEKANYYRSNDNGEDDGP
jgi:hypothetical protein